MASHEVAVRSVDTIMETEPKLDEALNEKRAAVNVQELSVTASPTPSLRRRNENSTKTRKQLPLDRFFKTCSNQSPFIKALVLTFISGIPFVVFLLVALLAYPKKTSIGGAGTNASLTQLAKWLLISWATFMGLLWCGRIFAAFSTWACKQSQSWIKYQRLVEALCLRVVLMFWAIICFAVTPTVFHNTQPKHEANEKNAPKNWIQTLQEAFKFLIIAFALIVVQGIVLELSSILYIQGWMGPRSQRASDELDTIKQLHDLVDPHTDDQLHLMGKLIRKLVMPIDEDDLYYQISRGCGNPEIWTEYAHSIWDTISGGKSSISRFDIDQQLRAMNRDPDRGHDLFTQLDESCDGEVTFEEVDSLVQRVGLQLNVRNQAQHGIKRLLGKLEILLSIVMLAIIFIVWVQFFKPQQLANIKNFWTGLMGLSFAFAGVVSEFVNSCVFVFGKHPYDVGDYIEAKGRKFIVQKIFLTHTNFEEVTDPKKRGVVVQASHASLFAEMIVNWTRTLEDVVEEKSTSTKETAEKDKAKAAAESKATDDVRELVQLKVEQLKGVKLEEKY